MKRNHNEFKEIKNVFKIKKWSFYEIKAENIVLAALIFAI